MPPTHYSSPPDRPSTDRDTQPDLNQLVASVFAVLDQSPPPSLREILGAYKSKGDGDRDMLLAMLNAKSAEDQRIASVAALHKSILEVYQGHPSRTASPPPLAGSKNGHHYPTQSPQLCVDKLRRPHQLHHPHPEFRGRSPPLHHHHTHLPSMRDAPYHEPPRKRHRSSHSPVSYSFYEPQAASQLPPSPYSSSERSESGDYSPRSRASMAIGSLLSSRPKQESNGDEQ